VAKQYNSGGCLGDSEPAKYSFYSALWTLTTTPFPTSVVANLSTQAAAKVFVKGSI